MDKKNLLIELSMPVFMGILAVLVIAASGSMGSEGVFPRLIAYLLLIGALVTAVQTVRSTEKTVILENLNWKRVVLVFVMLLAYILLLDRIGYILSTFLLCAGVIRLLGYRSYFRIVLCSAVTVALVFVLFKVLLLVPLPLLFLDL